MARSNRNWNTPYIERPAPPSPTSFEQTVKAMRLSPAQYKNSVELKEWVRKNKDHKYVPLELLELWGFEVKGEL